MKQKLFIIMVLLLFSITGCDFSNSKNEYEKLKEKANHISFTMGEQTINSYSLRYKQEDEIINSYMAFYKGYIVVETDSLYFFNKESKTLYLENNDVLTKVKELTSNSLGSLINELQIMESIEFCQLDYEINNIVNNLINNYDPNVIYYSRSVTKQPGSSQIVIKKDFVHNFQILENSINDLLLTELDYTEIDIRIYTLGESTTVETILISLKDKSYKTLYNKTSDRTNNSKIQTIIG